MTESPETAQPTDHRKPGEIIRIGPPDPARRASDASPLPVIELTAVGLRGLYRPHYPGQHRSGRPQPARPGLLDLTVWAGELVVLTGPPGSGKSALLQVIGLLDRQVTGSYLLTGLDVAGLGDRDRAALRGRHIGSVLQRPNLLPVRSALDNVILPLRYAGLPRRDREPTALAALGRVGLTGRAQVMTDRLSAAERRLVAIARALAAAPGLLLCDDPTASLDPATAARVIRLLIDLHKDGTTILIATHDQLAAAHGTQLLAMAR
jgi:putative ABC transport system ATP-binding protein